MELTELTCPICMDIFTKPISLPCGHNFCQICICIIWNVNDDDPETGLRFCPECQILFPPDLKPEFNTDLELKVKQISACGGRDCAKEETALSSSSDILCDQCIERSSVAVKTCLNCDASLCSAHTLHHQHRVQLRGHTLIELTEDLLSYKCKEHGEEQKVFCQDDQAATCALCVLFGTHKSHRVIQLQEACSDFKEALEKRDTELMQNRHLAECALQDLQRLGTETAASAAASRDKITETYSQIKALIVKDQQLMMDIIEMEEFYTNKWLVSRKKSLEQQIKDINSLLSESKSLLKEHDQLKLLKNLKRQTYGAKYKSTVLPSVDTHTHRMETVQQLAKSFYKAVVQLTKRLWANWKTLHLDADTAHPNLEVSSDLMEVYWSKQIREECKGTKHVDTEYSILAKESFFTGSHYWEIAVWEKPYWLIGLSYESDTQEQGGNAVSECVSLKKAFCYLYHGNERYLVCNGYEETRLTVEKKIHKVGVSVEIQKGTVSFYDADTMKLLHLSSVEFLGPVRPLFNPCLCLNDQNTQSLVLLNYRVCNSNVI